MSIYRWTLSGSSAGYHGTLDPGVDESGEMEAELAGEVAEWVVQHGPWDLIDQGRYVTITIELVDELVEAGRG
jgi:hypothetical protein